MTWPTIFTEERRQRVGVRGPRRRILEVIEATSAGVGRYVADLLLRIDTGAFDVSLAYSPIRADARFWRDLAAIQARGIATFEIPMVRSIRPWEDATALWRLYRMMRQYRFDVVHGHSSKAGFLARIAAKMAHPATRTVYSPHAIAIAASPAYGHLERFVGRFTDAMLAVSRSERDELVEYDLVTREKLHYVTAGIDIAAFTGFRRDPAFRERIGVPDNAVLIGTAGRIARQKDPLMFVAAAAEVCKADERAYFAWAGDGEMRQEAEELAVRLGIAGRVRFAGYFADPRAFLASLDVFTLTSRYESFGYVTCEAMAMGKPVVATNVAGSKELVADADTGYLTLPGDAAMCSAALLELVRNRSLRRAMGEAARKRVREHYDVGRMVRQVEDLYRDLMEDSSTWRPYLKSA